MGRRYVEIWEDDGKPNLAIPFLEILSRCSSVAPFFSATIGRPKKFSFSSTRSSILGASDVSLLTVSNVLVSFRVAPVLAPCSPKPSNRLCGLEHGSILEEDSLQQMVPGYHIYWDP